MIETLIGPRVFDGQRLLPAGTGVALLGGKIAAVGAPPPDSRTVRLDGGVLAPGFIDLQVNGGGGMLFNDAPTAEAAARIAAAHRRFGTTSLLATLISDDATTTEAAIGAVEAALAAGAPGVLGLHLEGPFLDTARRGVHLADRLRGTDAGLVDRLCAARIGCRLITVSPNQVPPAVIGALTEAGVTVALGHTEADYDTAVAAFDAGARGVTHLFNAMSQLGSREPGMVGAALDRDDVWCGLIVDGHHVHPASLRLAVRAKPAGGALLVTDAMPPVGAAEGGGFTLQGETIGVVDGVCRAADGRLAGSALDMATGVANLVRRVGLPLEEALRMASRYPAAAIGLADSHGRLTPGMAADLVWLDDDLAVRATWIAGAGEFYD